MRFARIDEALEVCENHLHFTGSSGTIIERLMSDSLLVIIYAEFEYYNDGLYGRIVDELGKALDGGCG